MRIIDLALKDLLQVTRDKKSFLFLVAMPLLFTLFFGWMFSSSGDADPRLPVGVVFGDQDPLNEQLLTLLESSDAIRPVSLTGRDAETVEDKVSDETLAAALLAPAGFGERARAGDPAGLTLIVDPASQAGYTARSAVTAATSRLLGAIEAARISASAVEEAAVAADRHTVFDAALAQALAAWQNPPLGVEVEMATVAAAESETNGTNPYGQASPGMIVQFAVYGLIVSAMVLVLERKSGALQRLLTTPISRASLIAGHVLAMFVVSLSQIVLLVAVGQLLFDVPYMHAPLATVLMVVSMSLWAACSGLLIGTLAKEEGQVIMYTLIAMMVLSALGGAWFPLEITGPAFNTVGHLTPTAWAMDGMQNVVVRGLGLDSVLLPAGILLAYAVVSFGLAIWRFKFE